LFAASQWALTVLTLVLPHFTVSEPGLFHASSQLAFVAALSLVALLSLGTGRTTILQGAVHLVIFGVYLFTTVIP
jgi:Ca2+:H+ antiporter